jgi:aspartyl-tRNA(Asn)/glutamyl-tRNA(Gln) amidotransferase subunit A
MSTTYTDLTDVSAALARRDLSPVDLLERQLTAIDRLNPILNAYITVMYEDARQAAAAAEREIAA